MPAVSELRATTPVALLFGDADSCAHLREILVELGAELVFAENIAALEPAALAASGAQVVVVSLDDAVDERFEEIDSLLEAGSWRVLYDDPEISAALSGWEQARWLRHLRAKLHDQADVDPPRPESARPVEVSPARTTGKTGATVSVLPLRARVDETATKTGLPADSALPEPGEGSSDEGDPTWMAEALGLLQSEQGEVATDDIVADDGFAGEDAAIRGDDADNALSMAEAALQNSDMEPAPVNETAGADPDELSLDLESVTETEDLALDEALSDLAAEPSLVDAADEPADFAADLVEEPTADAEPVGSEASDDVDYLSLHLDARGDIQTAAGKAAGQGDEDWLAQFHGQSTSAGFELTIGDIEADASRTKAPVEDAAPTSTESPTLADPGNDAEPASDESLSLTEWDDAAESASTELPSLTEWDDAAELASSESQSPAESGDQAEPEFAESPPAAAEEKEEDDFTSVAVDSSQWSLVDYAQLDDIAEHGDDDPVDEPPTPDRTIPSEFGFELVDPSEYLMPEAPVDRGEELFSAPELMSMQEALAPVTESGSGEESDAAAGAATGAATKPRSQPLPRLVVLGASIGGPDAVREFLAALPERFPAAFVLAQHLGSEFVDLMIGQLAKSSALPVRQPANAETAVVGEVLVVPKGRQLRLARDGEVQLHTLPDDAAHDPSINLTFNMAAEVFGADTVAIVFSGMGNDAVSGALDIAAAGGEVWAQDPEQCVVGAMVEAVAEAGVIKFSGSPTDLARRLVEKFGEESAT